MVSRPVEMHLLLCLLLKQLFLHYYIKNIKLLHLYIVNIFIPSFLFLVFLLAGMSAYIGQLLNVKVTA